MNVNRFNSTHYHTTHKSLYSLRQFFAAWVFSLLWSTAIAETTNQIDFTDFVSEWTISAWVANCSNRFGQSNLEILDGWNDFIVSYEGWETTPSAARIQDEKNSLPRRSARDLPGFWAICPLDIPPWTRQITMSYTITTPENFDAGRWMKLLWICTQECPRWGQWDNVWASLRVHSIETSESNDTVVLSAYSYGEWNDPEFTWKWQHHKTDIEFRWGEEYFIEFNVDINTWNIELTINQKSIYNIPLWDSRQLSLFLSSFYWGSDDWGPENDTNVEFWDFNIEYR